MKVCHVVALLILQFQNLRAKSYQNLSNISTCLYLLSAPHGGYTGPTPFLEKAWAPWSRARLSQGTPNRPAVFFSLKSLARRSNSCWLHSAATCCCWYILSIYVVLCKSHFHFCCSHQFLDPLDITEPGVTAACKRSNQLSINHAQQPARAHGVGSE